MPLKVYKIKIEDNGIYILIEWVVLV
jgi:hypothetical protein